MLQPQPTESAAPVGWAKVTDLDAAHAERDEAIAERDYVLNFLQDLGMALGQSQRIAVTQTAQGVEVRAVYPSLVAALAANVLIRDLRALLSLGPRMGEAALQKFLVEVIERRFQA